MVQVVQVAQFVNYDVINDASWGHHALPVKGKIAIG